LERLSAPQEPVYDADEIQARLTEITDDDRGWERWFSASEIEPLRITYEELSADPAKALRLVLDPLGLHSQAADEVTPGTAKLADDINRDWVERFQSERHTR